MMNCIRSVFFFFFITFSFSLSAKIARSQKKPNVIIFFVDDLGWTDLGYSGSDYHQTPNIDELSRDGIVFTNSYSACTVCSPTRASLMTGKYPARLHLTDWIEGHKYPWAKLQVPQWQMFLDTAEFTIAEAFKGNGYRTIHLGKWHLGESEEFYPENQGFDINIGGWANGGPYTKDGNKGYFSPYGNPRLTDRKHGEYLTERLASEACLFLASEAHNNPFFMNFCFYSVHTPLMGKVEKIKKYQLLIDSTDNQINPTYAAMVEHVDDAIGKVIAQLKKQNLYDNTIILFSSDNGGLIGNSKKPVTSNIPLRGGKGSMYEGGVRIPTILKLPKSELKGRIIEEPVITVDYLPTLTELAGIKIIQQTDGESWVQLFSGRGQLKRKSLFWHYPHYHSQGAVPYSAVRKGDWKLIENFEDNTFELYNLVTDIGETINLYETNTTKVSELKTELNNWRIDVKAQYATPNPNYNKLKERKKSKK